MLEVICEELGVGVDEKWLGNDGLIYKIQKSGEIEVFDDKGVFEGSSYFVWEDIFGNLLKPVWKPKLHEWYYIPSIYFHTHGYESRQYIQSEADKYYYDQGLMFKTKEEAIEVANKMLDVVK